MQIFLRILKEVGIAIVLLGLLLVIGVFLFKDQLPFLYFDIPNAVEYKGIDKTDFDIQGDLENQKDPDKVYRTTNTNLRGLEGERKVLTGVSNPFVSEIEEQDSDLPTEKVTIENEANPKYEETEEVNTEQGNANPMEAQPATESNGEPASREL